MLEIFKNYPPRSSIVDGFYLYESRQRALQEKQARTKAQPQIHQVCDLDICIVVLSDHIFKCLSQLVFMSNIG